jgi:hypothetical protein
MTRLTDTQLIVLSAAAQRTDHIALPLPKSLKGGAAHKVIKPLIEKGLLQEVDANPRSSEAVWRDTGDGLGVTLVITAAGMAAIGLEADTARQAETEATAAAPSKERKIREGTKQALLIQMLRRPEGATLDELVAATGWQSHTVRGAMAGALKKKLGLTIDSEKVETRGRVYKVRG